MWLPPGGNGNYFALDDTLDEHIHIQVADPRQTKAIGTAEVKNDRLDVRLLAPLCRADMITESYVPAEDIRELRSLAGARKRLVKKRTDFKNEVLAVLDKQGVSSDWDPFSKAGQERLLDEDSLDLSEVARHTLEAFMSVLPELIMQIRQLETAIEQAATDRDDMQLLMTIPGVSELLLFGIEPRRDRRDRSARPGRQTRELGRAGPGGVGVG